MWYFSTLVSVYQLFDRWNVAWLGGSPVQKLAASLISLPVSARRFTGILSTTDASETITKEIDHGGTTI
jgi:hypothetical protein